MLFEQLAVMSGGNITNEARELEFLRFLSSTNERLPVFVVEDHNEALSAIYRGLRTRRLSFTDIGILHFDSHPDLSVPSNLPANIVLSDPEEVLHRLRNDSGGIAEWIIPPVFAGHVAEVVWVRPPWGDQIEDGRYRFFVGRTDAGGDSRMKVTCEEKYWQAENVVEAVEHLVEPKPFSLCVAQLPALLQEHKGDCTSTLAKLQSRQSWVLDICLDYFCTNNPFLNDLTRSVPWEKDVGAIRNFYREFIDRHHSCKGASSAPPTGASEQQHFASAAGGSSRKEGTFESEPKVLSHVFDQKLYNLKRGVLEKTPAYELLLTCLESGAQSRAVVHGFFDVLKRMDVEQLVAIRENGPLLHLPHHPGSRSEINGMLENLSSYLGLCTVAPRVVTIACSAVDGFTPKGKVFRLLQQITRVLKDSFGEVQVYFDKDVTLEL